MAVSAGGAFADPSSPAHASGQTTTDMPPTVGQPTPSAPPAATSAPATASTAASEDMDRIVCKQGDPPTGTRLGARRICQTNREWDAQMRRDQQELERQQQLGGTSGMPGGG